MFVLHMWILGDDDLFYAKFLTTNWLCKEQTYPWHFLLMNNNRLKFRSLCRGLLYWKWRWPGCSEEWLGSVWDICRQTQLKHCHPTGFRHNAYVLGCRFRQRDVRWDIRKLSCPVNSGSFAAIILLGAFSKFVVGRLDECHCQLWSKPVDNGLQVQLYKINVVVHKCKI